MRKLDCNWLSHDIVLYQLIRWDLYILAISFCIRVKYSKIIIKYIKCSFFLPFLRPIFDQNYHFCPKNNWFHFWFLRLLLSNVYILVFTLIVWTYRGGIHWEAQTIESEKISSRPKTAKNAETWWLTQGQGTNT